MGGLFELVLEWLLDPMLWFIFFYERFREREDLDYFEIGNGTCFAINALPSAKLLMTKK